MQSFSEIVFEERRGRSRNRRASFGGEDNCLHHRRDDYREGPVSLDEL